MLGLLLSGECVKTQRAGADRDYLSLDENSQRGMDAVE